MYDAHVPEIPCKIERTRNRTSRAILRDGTIVVRLAGRLTHEQEQEHIEILLRRMKKAAAKELNKETIQPFEDLITRKTNTLTLKTFLNTQVMFQVVPGRKTQCTFTQDTLHITRSETISDSSFRVFLWRVLSSRLYSLVVAKVKQINEETFKIPVTKVSLKFTKSRWGSCSMYGTISLSTPLLFTTPEIFRYVVIHELAHRRHLNHSFAFWNLVSLHCPKYKELAAELRKYRLQ